MRFAQALRLNPSEHGSQLAFGADRFEGALAVFGLFKSGAFVFLVTIGENSDDGREAVLQSSCRNKVGAR